VIEHAFQGLVLAQQLARYLGTDQRNAGHVIDRIANERLKIDDLIRADSPFLLQRRRIEHLVLADIVDFDPLGNQLSAILVAGHHVAIVARTFRAASNGG